MPRRGEERERFEPHRCAACAETPGFVVATQTHVYPAPAGQGMKETRVRFMRPCPNRGGGVDYGDYDGERDGGGDYDRGRY